MRRPLPSVSIQFDSFRLEGGLDLHTPQLDLPPGVARAAENFEVSINGGYSRIPGYERFDGRPSPSAAAYATLRVTGLGMLAVGATVNGQTSGATAVVAAIDGDIVAYTKLTGTFVAAENLRVGVTVVGVISEVGALVEDPATRAGFQLAAANIFRADIQAMPGSGPVRGGFTYKGTTYALRDNAGGTACLLYRASGAGWVVVPFLNELAFTAGSGTQPAEGATITKGAVSAVVRRVVLESGTWAAGTAAGRFIVDAPTGGSFTAGAFTAGVTATAAGAQTAITQLPGGRYETHRANAGHGERVYGADGVNRGWEFDGTVFVPIKTGNSPDTPRHVRVHKRHLFFSFGASVQHAGTAFPYQWTAITGAAELGVNEDVTGFLGLPGDSSSAAMAVLMNSGISVLYGSGPSTWNLIETNVGSGAKRYSSQSLMQSYMFNDLGVSSLQAVQEYGNFSAGTLTSNLRQFVQARRNSVTDSLVNREKSQYRVFFSDGYGLFCTIVNGNFKGAMPVLFPNPVAVSWNGESTNGAEVSYFGSSDGRVYRMDIGTSFDGADIPFSVELSFANQGSDQTVKRYRRASFELQGDGYAELRAGYSLAYDGTEREQIALGKPIATDVAPAYWDLFTWDQFVWDGRLLAPSRISMEGAGENISMRFEGQSALWPAFTINSVTLHYTPRRISRG